MQRIVYPNYENCIANLPNSILKAFGIEPAGTSLKGLDRFLEKEYKNVVVLLLDGMGQCIMERNLSPDGFFAGHLVHIYDSVFPPTTVAATTSALSGLAPNAHGWLGWDCYYPQLDQNVTVFWNRNSQTGEEITECNAAWTYCGYESVIDKINQAGGAAYMASPYSEPYPQEFSAVCSRILQLCREPGKKYIYGYWPEPDHMMHEKGCYAPESKAVLAELEKQVEALCRELTDTLVVVTADHGHLDSAGVSIEEYPELMDCLERMPSIEPRALNLFVKKEKQKQFEQLFRERFGDTFLLFTKEQVKEKRLFGTGPEHSMFDGMLGDYLAVAVNNLSIYNTKEKKEHFIGVHAGLTQEEVKIPLIVVEREASSV